MKIGIVTIYESITNLGSFLQGYAMKIVLEEMGHEVFLSKKKLLCILLKNVYLKSILSGNFYYDVKKRVISIKM